MITYQLNTPQEFKEEPIQLLDIFEFNQRTDRRYEFKTIYLKDQHNNTAPIEQALLKRPFKMNIGRYCGLLSLVSKLTGKHIDGLGSLYSACIA